MLGSNSNADSGPKNQADYPSCYPVWFFRERIPLRDWHKAINSAGLFLPASEASGWMPQSGGQGLSEAKALVCGFRQRLFCRKPERMDQPCGVYHPPRGALLSRPLRESPIPMKTFTSPRGLNSPTHLPGSLRRLSNRHFIAPVKPTECEGPIRNAPSL